MRGLLLLILTLVARMQIISNKPDKCSSELRLPDFSATLRCGYSFPALDNALVSSEMDNWAKTVRIVEIIQFPWSFKIPAEGFECFWKAFKGQEDAIITAIMDFHKCRRKVVRAAKENMTS